MNKQIACSTKNPLSTFEATLSHTHKNEDYKSKCSISYNDASLKQI